MLDTSTVRSLLALSLVSLLHGCASGRGTPVGHFPSIDLPLQTIALAPSGGIFADVIGIELAAHGYTIVDTGATLALLMLMQKTQDELFSPEVMDKLKERGIDAVLAVQKVDGMDGLPQTVQIRLHSTALLADVADVNWENKWIRRGIMETAREIAAAVSQEIRSVEPPPAPKQ